MNKFSKLFNKKCSAIGMIHVQALPGTPKYANNFTEVLEKAKHEAYIYNKYSMDGILIENMHDLPYVQDEFLGSEIVACMTRICSEVKTILPNIPCGIQILASCNKSALSVAKACGLQFIRAEGFVFGHIADEGYTDACAGQLLRYRKQIDAENVLVFTDLKKKHSSHAITKDVSLLETAIAAEFFLTDGIILTGASTGKAINLADLDEVHGKVKAPILIGSGVTANNLENYCRRVNAIIVGSHFKKNEYWENDLCENAISKFMDTLNSLRIKHYK